MKKYFLSIVALVGMLFATSCQESLVEPQVGGPTTFTVQVPDGMGTKAAIGSKENVNQLLVAVYSDVDNDQQPLVCKTVEVQQGTGRFDVSFDLIKGQTYDLIFWAQTTNAYVAKGADDYDLRRIQMNANYPNNENGAAFFHFEENFMVDGVNATITLRRPFAQLNLRTTADGLVTDANTQPMTLYTSKISVTNVATKFNTVSGMGEDADIIEFEAANVPQEDVIVGNDLYKYVSMNYLPVVGDDRALVDVTAEIVLAQGPVIKHSFTNIPLQENYRTNIMGNLISGTTNFEVIVNDDWSGDNDIKSLPYFTVGEGIYDSFIRAYDAAPDGGVIKINGGIPVIEAEAGVHYVTIAKDITLDLNGYGLNASIPDIISGNTSDNTAIFQVVRGAEFTIKGEGNVHLNTAKCINTLAALISNEGGTVNVESGNYTITALEYPDALIPTFIDNNSVSGRATLNISGGTFTFHRNLFRNFSAAAGSIMNISGGTFNGLPYDAGTIWNQKPSNNGYGVINVTGGIFNNVVIDDDFAGNNTPAYLTVSSAEELTQAIAAATTDVTIFLGNNIDGDATAVQQRDIKVTIIGNQKTFKGSILVDGKSERYETTGLIIDGVQFMGDDATISSDAYIRLGDGTVPTRYTNHVTVQNCIFSFTGTKDVAAVKSYTGGDYNVKIIGCTVNTGMHSLAQFSNIEKGLEIKGCNVYSKNGANLNYTPNASFTGCEFDVKGYAVRVGVNGSNSIETKVFNFTDCTLKSAGDDGDAVVIIRQDAQQATLNFVRTTLVGTTQISGAVDGKTTINWL